MKIKVLFLGVFVFFNSCGYHGSKESKKKMKPVLDSFAAKINTLESSKIKGITTEKGYKSILKWSDSLNHKEFLFDLSSNFSKFNVSSLENYDSLVIISLGKKDKIVGATGGYVFLKKVDGEYKIDLYRGGK